MANLLISALHLLSAQSPPGSESGISLAGLSTLETLLIGACGTLTATIGVVWKWGNDIRKENAAKFDQMGKEQTKLIVDQTADNKDVVHALQDMSKTLDRMATTGDLGPRLDEIKAMIQRLLDRS